MDNNEKKYESDINLMDMLFIIRKNIVSIAIVAVLMGAISFVYTVTSIVPLYQSTTQLLIKGLDVDAMTLYADSTSRTMLINNSIEVLSGTEVMQSVTDKLELEMSPEQLQGLVTISSPADTQVLTISVIHPDPEMAKVIASEFGKVASVVLAENIGVSALTTIQEAKIPMSPISPNPVKNAILGAFAGAFIVAAWVVIKRLINNKIYIAEDVEKALGLTVFASVPLVGTVQTSKRNKKGSTNKKEVSENAD